MPFVDRDPQGNVVGIFAVAQHEGQEYVEGDVELYVPPPPFDRNAAVAEAKAAREKLLNALVGIGFAALADPEGDPAVVQECAELRLAVLAPSIESKVNEYETYAQFRQWLLVQHYGPLVAAASTTVKTAFKALSS